MNIGPWRRIESRECDHGALAVIVALSAAILMVMAAFAVDIGRTWATRGQLQVQADQAAVATSSALPVTLTDASDRKRVAKYAAYFLACNKVGGQTFNLPVCASTLSPGSTSLDSAALEMLSNGSTGRAPGLRFPSSTSVEVITPAARINYTFGKAASVSGTTQVKRATAQVSSPGQMLPVALSKACGTLLSSELSQEQWTDLRGQADASLAMFPTRILALGDRADAPVRSYNRPALPAFSYPTSFGVPIRSSMNLSVYGPTLNVAGLSPYTWEVGKRGALLSVGPRSGTWGSIAPGRANTFFWKQDGFGGWTLVASLNNGGTLAGTFTIPNEVVDSPGSYYVTVASRWIDLNGGFQAIPASEAKQINVVGRSFPADALTRLDQGAGSEAGTCARYIDSPRLDTGGGIVDGTTVGNSTLIKNILGGLDHRLALQQNVAGTCTGVTVVKDVTVHTDATAADPNCVRITSKNSRQLELTTAWLGTASGSTRGRLDCSITRFTGRSNCPGRTFTLWGRAFNNDDLADYLTSPMTDLSDWRNFGSANYNSDGLPLISPGNKKLSSDIYYSPRLFWAPVISTPLSNIPMGNLDGNEYPVWTYRPVWLGRQVDGVGSLQARTSNNLWCTSDLGSLDTRDREYSEYRSNLDRGAGGSYTGVFLNGVARGGGENDRIELFGCNWDDPKNMTTDDSYRRIKGLRFQTIEPVSMPEPPTSYSGPLTDYVGTGPRVVRLVR